LASQRPEPHQFDPESTAIASNPLRQSAVERVVQELRESILDGRLRPGERLRQASIASEYGTSRIPVREALRQLASEGLVVLQPHAGGRVARLDLQELDEIYLLREQLEPFAIERSTPHLSDGQLGQLARLVEQMELVADPVDLRPWLALDREFHIATFSAAPMPRLRNLIDGLWNSTQHYRRVYTLLPQRLEIAHAEHRLLLEALERRDPEDAGRLLTTHIRRTRLTLEEHVELFD
jgi:DNA-binding GntR family transcriptional regulator